MPIQNYQSPGVYVTQSTNPALTTAPTNSLNIAFYGYATTAPTASQTDRFSVTVTGNGIQNFTLSQSGVVSTTSGYITVLNTTYGTTVPSGLSSFGGYSIAISGGVGILTVSGLAIFTAISATYFYSTVTSGIMYNFTNFNDVQNQFGPAITTSSSGTTVIGSPCTLASFLAFQNGAATVSCCNITATGNGSPIDFYNAMASGQSSLLTNPGIDVIVPLCYDTTYNVAGAAGGPLFNGLSNFLGAQALNGSYQRAFIGLNSTVPSGAQTLISTCAAIVNDTNGNSRTTLVAPQTVSFNPGLNSITAYTTGTMNLDGVYLAAALAGVFVGQTDVDVPITNKTVIGFTGIPNQISIPDSNTLQSYGVTVTRQDRSGNLIIRHGLTTNVTNWLTAEISINAIGDRLAGNLSKTIKAGGLIGAPMTTVTFASLQSAVLGVLTLAQSSGLIQGFQNIAYAQDTIVPTKINITFQYAPTIPLNYVDVIFSLDTQTGTVAFNSTTA